MALAIIFLTIMFAVLILISWRSDGQEKTYAYLKGGYRMLIGLTPMLLLAFLVAGFLEAAIPPELIQGWLGVSSGVKGYVISYLTGMLLPGGPYVTFPIMGAIFRAGASLGAIVTMATAWATVSVGLVIFELAFVGPRFILARIALMFWAPIVAGILAQIIFGG